jgi:hypothetical protein
MTDSNLPDVNALIEADEVLTGRIIVPTRQDLRTDNQAKGIFQILSGVFRAVFRNQAWKPYLNPAFNNMDHCEKALAENARLVDAVIQGIKMGNWQGLFHNEGKLMSGCFNTLANIELKILKEC